MDIVVIGAGVVGTTTAFALKEHGHNVCLVERNAKAGMETSFANAGQRSYGVVYPWASLSLMKQALPKLLKHDGPLKIHLPPSLEASKFMLATLRYAMDQALFKKNKLALLELGEFSRQCFLDLESKHKLEFSGEHKGLLQLASDVDTMFEYEQTAVILDQAKIPYKLLSPTEVFRLEPNMNPEGPLVGAIYYPHDGTGDCHQFTQELVALSEAKGIEILYNQRVAGFHYNANKINSVSLVNQQSNTPQELHADAFVVCAGCWSPELLEPMGQKTPIYPIKGYSITAPLQDLDAGPRSTVHDDYFKVVSTRLGNQLRATGFVEFSDFNRNIPQLRLATIYKSIGLRFTGCAKLEHAEPWAGFRPMTPDGPAMIGKGPRDNLYINTGHGTFGWTLSAGSAELIAQIIDKQPTTIDLGSFRPDRF